MKTKAKKTSLPKYGTFRKALQAAGGRCGIFCATDRIAFGVNEACRKLNLSVPNQMAILGVNNDEVICQLANPPLSSIDEGATAVGFRAAELLAALMAGEAAPKRRILLPHAGLRQRTSTNARTRKGPRKTVGVIRNKDAKAGKV